MVLAGLVGILASPVTTLSPVNFTLFVIPALAAALVARFSGFVVAAFAGLGLGMLDQLVQFLDTKPSTDWLPRGSREAVPFLAIAVDDDGARRRAPDARVAPGGEASGRASGAAPRSRRRGAVRRGLRRAGVPRVRRAPSHLDVADRRDPRPLARRLDRLRRSDLAGPDGDRRVLLHLHSRGSPVDGECRSRSPRCSPPSRLRCSGARRHPRPARARRQPGRDHPVARARARAHGVQQPDGHPARGPSDPGRLTEGVRRRARSVRSVLPRRRQDPVAGVRRVRARVHRIAVSRRRQPAPLHDRPAHARSPLQRGGRRRGWCRRRPGQADRVRALVVHRRTRRRAARVPNRWAAVTTGFRCAAVAQPARRRLPRRHRFRWAVPSSPASRSSAASPPCCSRRSCTSRRGRSWRAASA